MSSALLPSPFGVSMRLSLALPGGRILLRGVQGLFRQQALEPVRERVGVAGPAGRDVVAVLHEERRARVLARVAPCRARTALELGRIAERADDLVLHVFRVGPVVAAQPPGGEE